MCVSHINTYYTYAFFSQAHPTHQSYRTDVFADYEDLQIVVCKGTAVGRHSIGLGDDTDTHKSYHTNVFANYEDLQIVVCKGTAVGRHSIGLRDDTDARIFGIDESINSSLDDLTYDYATGAFIENNDNQALHRSSSPGAYTPLSLFQSMSSEVSPTTKKKMRLKESLAH